jgi:hypothetical protein
MVAQQRNFPGIADPYGGGFRHCMAACLLKRNWSFEASTIIDWYDLLNENSSQRSKTTMNNLTDMAAEQHGLSCAAREGTCEQNCLDIYPPTWRWRGPGAPDPRP